MFVQCDLDFSVTAPVAAGEVERLVAHLANHPGFHTARQLYAVLALPDRKIRQIAEASAGLIVSGPGSPGYCHLDHCPTEKLAHIADTLLSQGRSMIRRSIRTRKLAHSRIR
jgi:hypothetical protein